MNVVKTFVDTYRPYAEQSEKETGIPALFSLAQAALESGWGKNVKGNNMFGIKARPNAMPDDEQLILTTEYNKRKHLWEKIKAWFRKYKTPKESFTDHALFLLSNPRYKKALEYKQYPQRFAQEVAEAGYATDPNYAQKLITIMKMIKPYFN
ncbi:MAG: peptidoglycan hydrolase [Chitinophagaceae bacterium]|nr:MAG: peptidoglycan hydrolase [Chitinophagaceae bacterium]